MSVVELRSRLASEGRGGVCENVADSEASLSRVRSRVVVAAAPLFVTDGRGESEESHKVICDQDCVWALRWRALEGEN